MKYNQLLSLIIATFAILSACSNGGSDHKKDNNDIINAGSIELSLADKNIPISINVPKGTIVKKGAGVTELNGVKFMNYTIKANDLRLNVSMPDADVKESITDIMKTRINACSRDKNFSVIVEEPNGLIYKYTNTKGDAYKCIYTIIKNNRQIDFTSMPPLSKNYTEEQVKKMFAIAKSAR